MVYKPLIPASTDRIPQSQLDILENMTQIAKTFAVDHMPLTSGTHQGTHRFARFPQQGSAPSTAVDQFALYSRNDSGVRNLYGRPESNATVFQATSGTQLYQGIKLEAYVIFDDKGNIKKGKIINEDGSTSWVDIKSANVSSVTWTGTGNPNTMEYTVAFNPLLSSANCFWVIDTFSTGSYEPGLESGGGKPIVLQPKNAVYGSVITISDFKIEGYISRTGTTPDQLPNTLFVQLQVYNVY